MIYRIPWNGQHSTWSSRLFYWFVWFFIWWTIKTTRCFFLQTWLSFFRVPDMDIAFQRDFITILSLKFQGLKLCYRIPRLSLPFEQRRSWPWTKPEKISSKISFLHWSEIKMIKSLIREVTDRILNYLDCRHQKINFNFWIEFFIVYCVMPKILV